VSDQTIIFSMLGVGKTLPTGKKILDNIYLSFYYGAKIGVLGLNGAGKSTLLRIIAGTDPSHDGEIQKQPGLTIGMLEQEPDLGDPSRTVKEVVEEGMAESVGLLKRYEEISAGFAEPDADFDALVAKQSKLQEQLDKHDTWNLDSHLEVAMDALRCPPGIRPSRSAPAANVAASPSPVSCSPNPTSSCSTSPPTTSTPSLWRGSNITCANTKAP